MDSGTGGYGGVEFGGRGEELREFVGGRLGVICLIDEEQIWISVVAGL
jgi:hypothetical protein